MFVIRILLIWEAEHFCVLEVFIVYSYTLILYYLHRVDWCTHISRKLRENWNSSSFHHNLVVLYYKYNRANLLCPICSSPKFQRFAVRTSKKMDELSDIGIFVFCSLCRFWFYIFSIQLAYQFLFSCSCSEEERIGWTSEGCFQNLWGQFS